MPSPNNQVIWTVSALNHEVKTLLERGIGQLWLEGEISNLSKPASGHWYFSLKDQKAQIRVAMFKSKNNRVAFNASNGQHVLIRASVSLYEARGEFQVIAEHMEEAGTGKLMREFEALKAKLKQEGLFETTFKQNIPRYPNKIGIITSPSGAAIRDALSVLQRRCPATEVIIYPCVVQGDKAASSIINALGNALNRDECDVLLMIRGGGSIEDMWCFNDETLAHLIHQSIIPIITGIGHEIDFTIADFVADFRAPTPSVAAESASIDNNELKQQLDFLCSRLSHLMNSSISQTQNQLNKKKQYLLSSHPIHAVNVFKHRLTLLKIQLKQSVQQSLNQHQQTVQKLNQKLNISTPLHVLDSLTIKIDYLKKSLSHMVLQQQNQAKQHFFLQTQKLDTLSPLKTLSRGFASISQEKKPITSVKQTKLNEEINIHLKDGKIKAKINDIKISNINSY